MRTRGQRHTRSSGAIIHVTAIQRVLPLYQATLGYAAARARV